MTTTSLFTTMFEVPVRMTIVQPDGETKVLDVISFTVEGALRSAPSAARLKPASTEKRKQTYPVPEMEEQDLKDLTNGKWDDPKLLSSVEQKDKTIKGLCALRRRFFKLSSITFTVHDAQVFTSMIAGGVLPSQMARAIFVASRDEWWMNHGDFDFLAIQKHAARLSSNYEKAKSDPRVKLKSVIEKLRTVDPQYAAVTAEAMAQAKTSVEFEKLLQEAAARLARG